MHNGWKEPTGYTVTYADNVRHEFLLWIAFPATNALSLIRFYTVITNNHLENFYHEFLPCWDSSWSCRHDWQVPALVRQVLCQWQQTAPNFCVQANSATELWAANREWGIKISSISFSILSTKFEIKKARLISDI